MTWRPKHYQRNRKRREGDSPTRKQFRFNSASARWRVIGGEAAIGTPDQIPLRRKLSLILRFRSENLAMEEEDCSISKAVAVTSCTAMTLFYVAVLYAPTSILRLPPPPSLQVFMIRRFICAFVSTVVSVVVCALILPVSFNYFFRSLIPEIITTFSNQSVEKSFHYRMNFSFSNRTVLYSAIWLEQSEERKKQFIRLFFIIRKRSAVAHLRMVDQYIVDTLFL